MANRDDNENAAAYESWLTVEALSVAMGGAFDLTALVSFLTAAGAARMGSVPAPHLSREKIAEFGALLVVINCVPDEERAACLRAMRGDDHELLAVITDRAHALLSMWQSTQQGMSVRRENAGGPEELETIA